MYFNSQSFSRFLISLQKKQFQSWGEFYSNTEKPTPNKYSSGKKQLFSQVLTELNYYVHNAIFKSLSSSTNGGGISITAESSDLKVLIEESYFSQCIATNYGGCIYKAYNGHCVINKVCGTSCETKTDRSPFCYIQTDDTTTQHFNYIFKSYINLCESENNGFTIFLKNGATRLKDMNMSRNSVFWWSCFQLRATITDSAFPEVSFSTFESNDASGQGCLNIYANNLDAKMKNINCLYNNQDTTTEGLVLSEVNTRMTIEDSAFIGNNSPDKYFHVKSGGSITLKNCSIAADQMAANTQLTTNAKGDKSFLNDMNVINERNCLVYVYKPRISCSTKEGKSNVFLFSVLIVQF